MSTRVADRLDDWAERSFSGGYGELHSLADREFSGVVRAGGTELYLTKGVAVGVRHGRIEEFEDASGTTYEAPSPALPLLAVMQDRSEEVRDKFYSEQTPISEVDSTLSEGGFTGYVELSENVLSGDYFLVYHAGESMSVAFVGESRRLIHGQEAFETANDEVGIYEVRPVDVEPIEIPEPEEATTSPTGPTATGSTDPGAGIPDPTGPRPEQTDPHGGRETSSPDESSTRDRSDTAREPTAGTDRTGIPGEGGGEEPDTADDSEPPSALDRGEAAIDRPDSGAESGGSRADAESGGSRTDAEPGGSRADAEPGGSRADAESGGSRADAESGGSRADAESGGSRADAEPGGSRADAEPGGSRADSEPGASGSQPEGSSRDRSEDGTGGLAVEKRAVPSLDPARTAGPTDQRTRQRGGRQPEEPSGLDSAQVTGSQDGTAPGAGADGQPRAGAREMGSRDRIETLESRLDEREQQIDRLEEKLDAVTRERDDLREQLEAVREEREQLDAVRQERDQFAAEAEELEGEIERLEAEVERLEGELSQLERAQGGAAGADRRLSGNEALSGTDIFFRYHSKGDATLEKAHGGSTRQEEVNENLRLEKHTQFDAGAVAVGGQSYEAFLEDTVEYQFVEWLVRELLFEIRETGHGKGLKNLYDVLPAVDRAELAGVVEATYTSDGQETRSQEAFDVILRDRMGNPLLVANMNDSREAATASMMEDLVTSAERVGQSASEFAGAFLVTSSFFDPGALEVAEEATQGGLLSRDKRESFVNLSRKRGYHLCLVEARNQNFHLAVPEL